MAATVFGLSCGQEENWGDLLRKDGDPEYKDKGIVERGRDSKRRVTFSTSLKNHSDSLKFIQNCNSNYQDRFLIAFSFGKDKHYWWSNKCETNTKIFWTHWWAKTVPTRGRWGTRGGAWRRQWRRKSYGHLSRGQWQQVYCVELRYLWLQRGQNQGDCRPDRWQW